MPTITFMPSGTVAEVQAGTRLTDACRQAGFRVPAPCGEKGLCGKCRVKVLGGDIPADDRQRACLPSKLLAAGWRAACIVDVNADLIIAEPGDVDAGEVILTDFMAREARGGSGWWERDVVMAEPSTSDQTDDVTRFTQALGKAGQRAEEPVMALPLVAQLPGIVRASHFRCRAAGLGNQVLTVRSGDDESWRKLGLAVDIGTTTIAAALCDLDTQAVLAVSAQSNPQAARGDDVISRIDYASRGRTELLEMQSAAVKTLEELAAKTCESANCAETPLFVTVSANTVMNHLLLGVPPNALALSPFIPAFRSTQTLCASAIGWRGQHPPLLHVLPNISAYVGGDITAGMLAHDIHRLDGATLFLDVGTNGEIALAVNGTVYACATAAGPAFEGARIKQGMRAMSGAISRVGLCSRGMIEIGVVDSVKPALGLCGTGLLDAAAVLLSSGLMDMTGRILDQDELSELTPPVSPGLAMILHEDDDGMAVWLERPAGRGSFGVSLTQRDVREFQLAKGAVAAGVKVLLNVAGLEPEQVDRVLLAGGFGNYLDPASAVAVGLLPSGIAVDKVRSVGNASLAGARLCLLSEEERTEAEQLSRHVNYIELSGRPDFQEYFAEEMMFPEF